MREIKFRAWEHATGKLVEWDELKTYCGEDIFDPACFALQQSTNLHDKTGKEIYEGDILRTPHFLDTDGWQYLYHAVEWSEKYCGWFAKNPRSGVDNDGSLQLWVYVKNKDFAVIGNTYENPELHS